MFEPELRSLIQMKIDTKFKPLKSLGLIESLALRLAEIQSHGSSAPVNLIHLDNPALLIFVADHGVIEERISTSPVSMTKAMVSHIFSGSAAINCFLTHGTSLHVIDCGMKRTIETEDPGFIKQRLGDGTHNFAKMPAMRMSTVKDGLKLGMSYAKKVINEGSRLLLLGEIGTGNTSSASAVLTALTGLPVTQTVCKGSGISDKALKEKCAIIEQAVLRCKDCNPLTVLSEVGGFEIVQLVGAILAACEENTPVVIDGFITAVAALVATKIKPDATDCMVFAHEGDASAHRLVLELLNAQPILRLNLYLGEGTGAALALPIIKAAAAFYNQMESLNS